MIRPALKVLVLLLIPGCLLPSAAGQAARPASAKPASPDKGEAYYHFAMGHLYAELAGAYGNRGDYLNRAIDHYKQAIKLDPGASLLTQELSDLYIQAGRLREAVTEAEDLLKQNPDDLDARRMLARIYTRMIGDTQENRINEEMLRRSIEQYRKIVEKDGRDLESWLMLGRLHKAGQDSVESEKAFKKALELEPDNEEALTGLALVYSDVGDTKAAVEMLRRVADRNPNMRTLTTLASAYEQMRDYAGAASALRQAAKLAPANLEVKRALAQNLLLANEVGPALELYKELAQAVPRDAQVQLRLSQAYRQQRDFASAREAATKARELDPDNLEIRYNEVNLLEAEGKLQESATTLKELVDATAKKSYSSAEKSNRAILLERLGVLYRSLEQTGPAVAAFQEMGQLVPEMGPRAAAQVIDTYRQAKDFVRAEAEANAAAAKYPDDRMVRTIRASILADTGKPEQALAEARKLLSGKGDREGYLTLAQVCEKAKAFDEMAQALDAAEKLSESDEDKTTVFFMRGAMYEKMRKYDAAEAEFRKVLQLSPDSASALNYLGYMLADRGVRLEEAHKLIGRAVELEPANGAYLDSLGWVYFKMDRLEEAETYLRRALEHISRDPTIHDHLGDVLYKMGKLKEAVVQWQLSLKAWETSAASERDPSETAKVAKKLEGAKVRLAKESSASPAKDR